MRSIEAIVANYYPAIDRADVTAALASFGEDVVYQRADICYEGLPVIESFYRTERRIRGTHSIDQLWSDTATRTVFVVGRFDGTGEMGDPRNLGFADVWQFDTENRVLRRRTFLSIGHRYVQS